MDHHLTLRRLKPDLVLKSNECSIIIDVACPRDLCLEESVVAKIAMYRVLRDLVDQYYEEVRICSIVLALQD